MTFRIPFEDRDEFVRGQLRYWREGFDLEDISVPQGTTGMMTYDCERKDILLPYPVLVKRYAAFGRHRYNIFHLHHLKKFNKTMNCQAAYYITLVALDPATTSLVTIQVGVAEGRRRDNCSLNLSCFFSKPQGGTQSHHDQLESFGTVDPQLPHWPLDFNDSQRFYEVRLRHTSISFADMFYYCFCRSRNQICNKMIIFVYFWNLHFVQTIENLKIDLSQLQIVKVAIEIIQENDALQAMTRKGSWPWLGPGMAANLYITFANLYITFKGLALARFGELGEHVERKIIVSRAVDEHTRCMTLLGGYGFTTRED